MNWLTKNVLETALEAEMDEHLGYEKHDVSGSGNSRNGTRTKTVLIEIGAREIDVPRDTGATSTTSTNTAPPQYAELREDF